jgi:hypothetical protein
MLFRGNKKQLAGVKMDNHGGYTTVSSYLSTWVQLSTKKVKGFLDFISYKKYISESSTPCPLKIFSFYMNTFFLLYWNATDARSITDFTLTAWLANLDYASV